MIQDEWRVMNSGDPENVTSLIVDAKGYRIARAYPSRNGQETALARARVMAVAPEMAALLKQIMAAHRGQLPSECADLYGGGCGCPQCEQARALLARIEGGG